MNERALGTDQNLKFVYVVNEQNEVARRDAELGTQQGALQVIKQGLQPQERVIVNGLQRVRPGLVVNPKLAEMPVTPQAARPQRTSTGTTAPTASQPAATPTMQQSPATTQSKQ